MIIDKTNAKDYGIVFDEAVNGYKYLAEQLGGYFKKCCGFSIGKYDNHRHYISIGDNEFSVVISKEHGADELADDAFKIIFECGNIFIVGKTVRSVAYGTFEFIERFLGVKWLNRDNEYIPERECVEINETNIECAPCFPQRDMLSFQMAYDWEYCMHRRFISPNIVIENKDLGHVNEWYNRIGTTHNSHFYITKEQAARHPEFYSVRNPDMHLKPQFLADVPGSSGREFCYSNGVTENGEFDAGMKESVAEYVVRAVLKFKKEAPEKKYFMFGTQDNAGAQCYCERCVAKRNKYGTQAGVMIIFFNAVCREISERLKKNGKNDDFGIVIFAYHNTENPPVDDYGMPIDDLVVPDRHLFIRYAPIEADFSFALTDGRQSPKVKKQIDGWSNLTENLMMWDYPGMPQGFYSPSLGYLKDNMQLYVRKKMKYVMYTGPYAAQSDWRAELKSYVIGKAFWNSDLDVYATAEEYIRALYGVAADNVWEFFKAMERFMREKIDRDGMRITVSQPEHECYSAEYYPIEFLEKMVALLEDGVRKALESELNYKDKYKLVQEIKKVLVTPLRMICKNSEFYFGVCDSEYDKKYEQIADEIMLDRFCEYYPRWYNIVVGGGSKYRIVISAKASEKEKNCAKIFQKAVAARSGVELAIITDEEIYPTSAEHAVCIGKNMMFDEFFKNTVNPDDYEYYIAMKGLSVFITSGTDLEIATEYTAAKLETTAAHDGILTTVRLKYMREFKRLSSKK